MPPAGLLLSRAFADSHGREIEQAAGREGLGLELVVLPDDPDARLPDSSRERVELAYFSGDVHPRWSRAFFAATLGAPNLRWLHVFGAGVDHPVFQRFLSRGVVLTNSAGTTAEPIAQSAIGGLLMLARGFLHWQDAQRRRVWDPIAERRAPRDLRGQTLLVFGLGSIGGEIARLARSLGLHVIGVRRRLEDPGGLVDELHPPERLDQLLPRVDWLAIACPLTDETRRRIDARALELLPPGACVLNVSRGEIVEEKALAQALASGALGGAYLDVFESEPLPESSPLWELPNAILSPHNSHIALGNRARQAQAFLRNLVRYGRGEPLENVVNR